MVLERTDLLDQKDILVQYNDELINELIYFKQFYFEFTSLIFYFL